jgi:hypothetical protein
MPGPFATTKTLSWTANTESDLAGYRYLIGRAPTVYDDDVDVGDVTSVVIPIDDSGLWVFAVKAYDDTGNVSTNSAEVTGNWLLLGNF